MRNQNALKLPQVLCVAAIVCVLSSTLRPLTVSAKGQPHLSACATAEIAGAIYGGDYDQQFVLPTVAEQVQSAPPGAPVVFLHYDYFGTTPASFEFSYDLAPTPAGIDLVVEAYRRHGLQLVIDPNQTAIPYHTVLSFGTCHPWWDGPGSDCANFFDLKATYFHPNGARPWHYTIFGDLGVEGPYVFGGFAELPGYNFMITQGPDPDRYPDLYGYDCNYFGFDDCIGVDAGTFMHELGHNLSLRHGGFEDQNFKPNYISVMNYADQYGFFQAPAPGMTQLAGLKLDYSSAVLPTIDPSHIDERVGLGGPADSKDIQIYDGCLATPCSPNNFVFGFVPATGPFDWNQNGTIEPEIQAELNFFWWDAFWGNQFFVGPPMQGFDDWSEVNRFLNTPGYQSGHLPKAQIISEPVRQGPLPGRGFSAPLIPDLRP